MTQLIGGVILIVFLIAFLLSKIPFVGGSIPFISDIAHFGILIPLAIFLLMPGLFGIVGAIASAVFLLVVGVPLV